MLCLSPDFPPSASRGPAPPRAANEKNARFLCSARISLQTSISTMAKMRLRESQTQSMRAPLREPEKHEQSSGLITAPPYVLALSIQSSHATHTEYITGQARSTDQDCGVRDLEDHRCQSTACTMIEMARVGWRCIEVRKASLTFTVLYCARPDLSIALLETPASTKRTTAP